VKKVIYWFRDDLRLTDNPAFLKACSDSEALLPIYMHHPREKADTKWGSSKKGSYSQQFLQESILDLKKQLLEIGSDLLEFSGLPEEIIPELIKILGDADVYCQAIEAPEEKGDVNLLIKQNITVKQFWQSSMLDPNDLPFALEQMPDMFTAFRQKIENAKLRFAKPASRSSTIPSLPDELSQTHETLKVIQSNQNPDSTELIFKGGETAASFHIEQYFERRLPDTYKQTRNQLLGMDYSTKFSPWLAHGCCSARSIAQRLSQYEKQYGANESTYWIWFELLWRDYFSFLPFKYGKKLFYPSGLTDQPVGKLNVSQFNQWINGQTKDSFINAAMTELSSTGFMSNRMRQIVASYWIYDMGGDWRAGAAWFETQLIDYDVYSNQGNWLYIAGRGTGPRGGRPFNVAKQMRDHDPDGTYRKHWL